MTSPEPAEGVPPPEETVVTEALGALTDLRIPPDALARITAALRREAELRRRLGSIDPGPASGVSPLEQSEAPVHESETEDC